jgi:oligopeptide transport system permease protein
VTWGAVAGYAGGRTDELMMRFVDVLYALPTIFLVILLLVFFSRSLLMLFVALGLVQWLTMARIVRGQVLSLKQQTFVEAARALGAGARRVIFRHLVPNTLGPVVVYATLTVPAVILQEAFLSFLGLGVQPPEASWGTLIADGARVMALFPWLVLFPGLALSLTLLAFNFLGDGLRDALDPRAEAAAARRAGPFVGRRVAERRIIHPALRTTVPRAAARETIGGRRSDPRPPAPEGIPR